MIKNLELFERSNGEVYFMGVLCWNRCNRLHFMFDPQLQQLFIFDWEKVSNEDTKRIHDFMCRTFYPDMKIEETYRIA